MPPEKLEEKSHNRDTKKEVKKETKETLGLLELEMLVETAEKKAKEVIYPPPKSCAELYQKNPELVLLVKKVEEEFGVPEELLYATFEHESDFEHGAKGDWDLNSIGIGQIRLRKWHDLHTGRNAAYREFQEFVEKYYPGKKFKRGENLFVDIAASAAILKKLAEGKMEGFSGRKLVYLRGLYKGDRDCAEQAAKYKNKETRAEVEGNYREFVQTYRKYLNTKDRAQALL